MEHKQNLHTHSVFCDGRNTPEEIVETAISRGFHSLGFSMHCDPLTSGKNPEFPEKFKKYKEEILRLKAEWRGKFPIYLGVEYDAYADNFEAVTDCDYRIGSVHYLKGENSLIKIDRREPSAIEECVKQNFGGDFMKFSSAYYDALSELPDMGSFDIIGHFDLLTKHAESLPQFDTQCDTYRKLAENAISALRGRIPFFEVNTGAIARGYRSKPYPDMYILRKMKENGFGAVITTDCHNMQYLDCYMEDARELLREAGYTSRYILTDNGFDEVCV